MSISAPAAASLETAVAERRRLERELERLRLLVHRRVLWLRRRWAGAAPNGDGLVIADALADRALEADDRDAERAFYRDDPEAAELGRRALELARTLADDERALTAAGRPAPLATLERLFGLTSFDRDVLLLCLAPELDVGFERVLAYVQDDATRPYATPQLALALFAGSAEQEVLAWESMLPEAPLRRYRLVAADDADGGSGAGQRLRIEPRVATYLLGVNRLDRGAAHLVRPVIELPLTGEHEALADRLASALGPPAGAWPVVELVGGPGSGRRAVAHALADRLGLRLLELDLGRLPGPGTERSETLHLLEREAVLLQAAFLVAPDELEGAAAEAADEAVERLHGLVVVAAAERRRGDRERLSVRVPAPDAAGRRELWRRVLGDEAPELDGLVHQFELGPRAIARAAGAARAEARLRGAAAPAEDDLWQACRRQTSSGLDDLAQRLEPSYEWDDLVLPADEAQQLEEIAQQVAHRALVYEEWGFGERLGRGRGISALFAGPSGTGKTMAAEVLARRLELDLYRIDLAGVVSKWVGETERNLRRVFDGAERSGAILFFDEADALFGKRSEIKDSHDRYANIEVDYLLQRMEDYRGLAILATNRKSLLDDAFLRRLRFLVDFPFPDAAARRRIWRGVFPPRAELEELDWDALAGLEVAGGNIRNIALNAAFLAAAEGRPVGMGHVLHAARREYAKIDKLLLEAEFGAYYAAVRA